MSSSEPLSHILLNEKPDSIKKKVNKYAFSGGGATIEEHKARGGNLEVDVPYQLLRFFLEDDARLNEIATEYKSGRMSTGEIKQLSVDCITRIVVAEF